MQLGVTYDVPSTGQTMSMFFVDMLVFGLLAFYFDHIDSSNRGKSYSPWFMFEKSYWVRGSDNNKNELNTKYSKNIKYNKNTNTKSIKLIEENDEITNKGKFNGNNFNFFKKMKVSII